MMSTIKNTTNLTDDELNDLIESYYAELYRYACKLTRNSTWAADVTQDAVIKMWRFKHYFERGTNFRAWAYKILKNTFINQYRQFVSKAETPEFSFTPNLVTYIDESFIDEEISSDLKEAYEGVSDIYRNTMKCIVLDGLRYNEAAKKCKLKIGTVRSRVNRGKQQMRQNFNSNKYLQEFNVRVS